jgi:hypothetical protein
VFVSEGSERVKTATLSFKLNHVCVPATVAALTRALTVAGRPVFECAATALCEERRQGLADS